MIPPYSYCDGEYNLNIGGQKVVGTAQRVLLKKGGGQVVLSQACILIDADVEKIVAPVKLCNQLCGYNDDIRGDVHTPLIQPFRNAVFISHTLFLTMRSFAFQ